MRSPAGCAGLVGMPVGAHLDRDAFRLSHGILLLVFSAFTLLSRFQPQVARVAASSPRALIPSQLRPGSATPRE